VQAIPHSKIIVDLGHFEQLYFHTFCLDVEVLFINFAFQYWVITYQRSIMH